MVEPKVETKAEPAPQAESAPRTLNDILRERSAQTTLGDAYLEEKSESPAAAEPATESPAKEESNEDAAPFVAMGGSNGDGGNGGNYYDDNVIDDYEAEIARHKRTSNGLMLCTIILLVLFIPAAFLSISFGLKQKTIKDNLEIVESARRIFEDENSILQRNAEDLVVELESLKDQNDTMMLKYQEAVVMLEQLQKEKTYNYNQLAKYRKEVDMLKGVMKGYLRKIDSLNDINTNLQAKNVEYEKERKSFKERAEKAEEKADELKTKVRIGSVIRTGGVRLVALNDNGKPVKRVKVASRLRVDFELTANELAEPGEKTIYVCITDPEGYVLSPASKMIPFTFEGESRAASAVRKVSYENQSVPVSVFYDGEAFEKGTYTVDIYVDGRHCGSGSTYFE